MPAIIAFTESRFEVEERDPGSRHPMQYRYSPQEREKQDAIRLELEKSGLRGEELHAKVKEKWQEHLAEVAVAVEAERRRQDVILHGQDMAREDRARATRAVAEHGQRPKKVGFVR